MKTKLLAAGAALLSLLATDATAAQRYRKLPPVIISQSLTEPWIVQLSGPVQPRVVSRVQMGFQPQPRQVRMQRQVIRRVAVNRTIIRQDVQPFADQAVVQPVVYRADPPASTKFDPQFLPQVVEYETSQKPGTIVIDTNNRFLYLVMGDGKARRYGVGVGKPGFEWAGSHKITRKAEWPDWTPPKEMIAREAAKGHILPAHMEGGEANPLGARAMYLGSTIYRIHGTNAPWTIGYAVSSGCIRMRNEDVVDLYERVRVGTRVIVM